MGPKYGEEKQAILEKADVFVFPTFYENECFPLVLLEAMSHSLPIVTTDEGGIPDIVQDGVSGIICKRQDPVSVADALMLLIKDPALRREMGEAGRKRLENLFTEEMFDNKMKEILLCLSTYPIKGG